MPLDPEQVKERLHFAYVHAVVAKAGAATARPDPDVGEDLSISLVQRLPNGKYMPTGFLFHCQLKATTTSELDNNYVIYDMEADAYNKLATWEGTAPCILILFRLPEEDCSWLALNEEQFLMKNCCYWYHITDPPTQNSSKKRIKIPRTQIFTPEVVEDLLQRVRQGKI